MSTTIVPPSGAEAPAIAYEGDALRLLGITANLLPPEVIDARRGKKVRRLVALILAAGLLITAGWYLYAKHQTSAAQDQLSQSQDQLVQLHHDQAKYANVVKIQADSAALKAQLAQLMTGDLQWWQLEPKLQAVAPAGLTINSVNGTISAGGGAPVAAASANPLNTATAIGSMTIAGTAVNNSEVAAFVDALATVPGIADPFVTGTTSDGQGSTTFTITALLTKAALGGSKYAPTTAAAPTVPGSH